MAVPYTTAGKNKMLDLFGAVVTHLGLYQAATALTSVTGVAATDLLTKASHGLSNGDLVVIPSGTLSGGSGLYEEKAYFVVGVSGNDFQLARTSGGTAVDFTTAVTSTSIQKLTEISGGSPAYARKAVAFNAAALGTMDDSSTAAFDIPAAATVNYMGGFSASTAGTLYGLKKVTAEGPYGGQGTYTETDCDMDLLGDEPQG